MTIVEYKLSNYDRSFKLLSEIDLYEVNDDILPIVLIAFSNSAFHTQSYIQAVGRLQDAIIVADTKAEYYGQRPKSPFIPYGESITLHFNIKYFKFQSAKLQIGDTWLVYANKNEQMNHMTQALKIANEGFITIFSVNTRDNILSFLSLFNGIICCNEQFVVANKELIRDSVLGYISVLEKMKSPSYLEEIQKLRLLNNCLIDKYNLPETKSDVKIEADIKFYLKTKVNDDSGIKKVTLKENFISNGEKFDFTGQSPRKEYIIDKEFVLNKNKFISKEKRFCFNVISEDIYSNIGEALLVPTYFYSR